MNGIKVAYHQSGLLSGGGGGSSSKYSTSLVTSQQPERYVSDSDMFRAKGKLPPMIGQDRHYQHRNNSPQQQYLGAQQQQQHPDNKVQLSAGDLLGRTHEELVLLLIQLRRQSSALIKARDACLLEMESQVKLASLDISHRQECLMKTQELKHHVTELEKQLEKLKPLISLVDNMVKLGSSMSPRKSAAAAAAAAATRTQPSVGANTAVKRNLAPLLHQQQQQQQMSPPTYTNVQQQRNNNNGPAMVFHSTPQRGGNSSAFEPVYGVHQQQQPPRNHQGWEEEQISELESKHHQLAQLEKFVREEGSAIQKLTKDQHVLRLAIRGVRQQTNSALQNSDYGEVDRCRQQQLFLERELSQIHALLALSSKRLEDAAVEISRIEREISALHQQLHHRGRGGGGPSASSSPHHNRTGSSSTGGGGREMVWLEGELNRVQQHVSQLQARRQELSSQVIRLTSAEYFLDLDDSFSNVAFTGGSESAAAAASNKRKPISTWCETDLDSLNTVNRRVESPLYANSSGYEPPQHQTQTHQQHQQDHKDLYYDEAMMPVDINEADERMKRYYGIMPKLPPPATHQPQPQHPQQHHQHYYHHSQQQQQQNNFLGNDKEIRTVRIVKRESEKRQRDKTSKRSPYDDLSYGSEEADEEQPPPVPPPPVDINGVYDGNMDSIMDDPVLSQFSHVLTLPSKKSSAGSVTTGGSLKDLKRSSSQRNSIAEMSSSISDNRSDQWRGSLRPRRNLSSLSLGDRNSSVSLTDMESTTEEDGGLGSLESSTAQRSPVLTPVYTSDAAREIVEEMRRQDMMSARRAVPRHKRRHITISCSQPLALEALSPSRTGLSGRGRARDDVDLQRALRYSHHHPFAPDVVRSTISQSIRINEKTIDRLLCAPDKIVIPERYVPEQEVEEVDEEEKKRRVKKAESIRRMLTDSATVDIPRPPSIAATGDVPLEPSEAKEMMAKERQERDRFIQLNQMLIEEMKEKSKMAAAQTLSMESQYA